MTKSNKSNTATLIKLAKNNTSSSIVLSEEEEELYKYALESSQNLTDISQVQQLLQVLNLREQQVDHELDQLLLQNSSLSKNISSLTVLSPALQTIGQKTEGLSEKVFSTCQLAKQVSSKVRVLDLAQMNAQKTIQKVQNLIDLKWSVEGLNTSMERDDFEEAAVYVNKYLSFDEELLDSEFRSDPLNAERINAHVEKLTHRIKRSFDEAVKHEKTHDIAKFMKIFPMIGQEEYGLKKYTGYACSRIGANASTCLKQVLKDPNYDSANVDFVFLLRRLFEDIAACVEAEAPLIETHYGPGKTIVLLQGLMKECDRQSNSILETFINERGIERTVRKIKEATMSRMGSSVNQEQTFDFLSLDPVMMEIVMSSNISEKFDAHMRKKAEAELLLFETENDIKKQWVVQGKELLKGHQSELNKKVEELMSKYVLMEEFFMKQSILKAVKSAPKPEPHSLTSLMVDDIFYVCQKCIHRGMNSMNIDMFCAVTNNANNLLCTEYIDTLRMHLSTSVTDQVTQLLAGGDLNAMFGQVQNKFHQDSNEANVQYMVHLNNADTSAKYIVKLHDELINRLNEIYNRETQQKQILKATSCLEEFVSTSKMFERLLQDSMTKLCTSTLNEHIGIMFEKLRDIDYNMNDQILASYEVNDPFIQNFCYELSLISEPFKKGLTEKNYEVFCRHLVQQIALCYEKEVLTRRYNYNGGIRFDKDIRHLLSFLSTVTETSVRDKCARLTQMATILTFENIEDLSFYKDGSLNRLTSTEIRQLLLLRVDFKRAEIQKLPI